MQSNQNPEANPKTENLTASVEGQEPPAADPSKVYEWNDLGLAPEILETVTKAGYRNPSPVQGQAIPVAIQKRDVIASAQTGTGKTASFVLPMVQQFKGREGTFGLVLAPTREIAIQIHDTITLLGGPHGVRSIVLIGGVDYRKDAEAINSYPQIIVATPGRLCDHLDRGNVWLDFIQMVVLDEADRMLDMGFSTQLSRIMEEVPTQRQTMLFSATIPSSVQKLATKILVDPVRVSIGKPLSAAHSVEQRLLYMKEEAKNRELMKLLRQEPGSLIVFTRSKEGATRVWRSLHSAGIYDATYIHSDRLQAHREQALTDYKEGKYRVLIATDVAGRGIHIDGVAHVVNYDLPMEPEDYVHRIGRTGRAGQTGRSTTFVTSRDRKNIAGIERLIGKSIPAEYTQSWPEGGDAGPDESAGSRPGRGVRGGRGGKNSRGAEERPSRGGSSSEASAPRQDAAVPTERPVPSGAPSRILPRSEAEAMKATRASESPSDDPSSPETSTENAETRTEDGLRTDSQKNGEAGRKRRRRRGGKGRGGGPKPELAAGASPEPGVDAASAQKTPLQNAPRISPADPSKASGKGPKQTGGPSIKPKRPASEPVRASSLRSEPSTLADDAFEDPKDPESEDSSRNGKRGGRGRRGGSSGGSSSEGGGGTAFPV